MISKNQAKSLRALHRKKARREEGRFLVEGERVVAELLTSAWEVESLYASEDFLARYRGLLDHAVFPIIECSPEALSGVSTLTSNNAAVAVVRMPEQRTDAPFQTGSWTLALDDVNDPGNLGSLLRIADWYGIKQIVCSPETVELYNPKVIAASMGSFLRVHVHVEPLSAFFDRLPSDIPILGAMLEGDSVHTLAPSSTGGVLLLGSEAHGVSSALLPRITQKVTIPSFGGAESLNVSVAAAIICDNLARIHAKPSH